jgi:hypothetical protein
MEKDYPCRVQIRIGYDPGPILKMPNLDLQKSSATEIADIILLYTFLPLKNL